MLIVLNSKANLSEFDRIFNTNNRAVIFLSKLRATFEKSKGNGGNVSSVLKMHVVENWMSYYISKAAINLLETNFFETIEFSLVKTETYLDNFKSIYQNAKGCSSRQS